MSVIIKRIWNQNKMVNIESLHGMAFQAEDGGHVFEISGVNDAGEAVPLSGTVAGVFMRPDRADIALTGSASGGVVSVTLNEYCYAVPGRFGLTIFVTDGGKKTAVYAAVGTISTTEGGGVAGDTPQDVVDLINAIEAAIAEIPASYTDIMAADAPTYSSSAVYAVGQYAWYDGVLKRCVVPITSGETYTAAHWETAVIGADLYGLSNTVSFNTYRNKDTNSNRAPAFTQFIPANAGFSASNPMGPTDLPINSYAFALGSFLAGFNNDVFTLTSSALYCVFCLTHLGNANYRQYFIFNRAINQYYVGTTSDGGTTITWHDHSEENINSAIGGIEYSQTAVSRTLNIDLPVTAGTILYTRLTGWTGDSYDYVAVFGVRSNTTSVRLATIYETDTHLWSTLYCEESFSQIRIIVHTENTPITTQTLKAIVCRAEDWYAYKMLERSPLNGKYLSILGASTSTFEGYIPEGNAKYYPYTGTAYDGSGPTCVTNVYQTYWMRAVKALGMNLLVNNSSSGSFLTTGHGSDAMAGCGDRCVSLHTDDHDPDIIVIQMGMNDFNYETDIGAYDGTSTTFPTDTTKFREAYAIMLNKMMVRYPKAIIVCGTIPNHEDNFTQTTFPERNDAGVLLKTFNEAIKDIADLFGVKVVDWYASGISYQNLYLFTQDYSFSSHYGMHANKYGHALMANELIKTIDPSCKLMFAAGSPEPS